VALYYNGGNAYPGAVYRKKLQLARYLDQTPAVAERVDPKV
jgi:hypothetical protein